MSVLEQPSVQQQEPGQAALAASQAPTSPALKWASQSTPEFLAWVGRRPRTYAETMEAWQTSCPRNSVWEDALGDGLIQLESDGRTRIGDTPVTLTALGRAIVDGR
jgi:hypothetical protein